MEVITTVAALRARLGSSPGVAFVPTMGNLHEGHLDLVRIARDHGQRVVVSIFVNRLQFGPTEDFDRYPRTLDADLARLAPLGVDVIFAPNERELYPVPQQFFVEPPPIASDLCGAHRPGHFRGMATVVLKLFNAVQPALAVFGKKDYQQLFIIRSMVEQLNLPVRILAGETRREPDGLAMSSRNQYLAPADRIRATALSQALARAKAAIEGGRSDYAAIAAEAREFLDSQGFRVDYVAARKCSDLLPPKAGEKPLVVLGAAWLGATRLIDNMEACIAA
ncbi:MAG: pantoate--beta-alanine ligase [Burkholderiales bacterium]